MKNLKWALIGIAIIGVIAYFTWNRQPLARDDGGAAKEQTRLSTDTRETIALAYSSRHSFSSEEHEPTALETALVLREISPQTAADLVQAYNASSKQFDKDEASALILASVFLNNGRLDDYQLLAAKFEGRTAYPAAWFALKGDLLLAQGKKEEAIIFLGSQDYEGPQDLPRLMRLAMLNQEKDYEASLAYLQEAERKDPQNPLLPILRSRLFEKSNKIMEAAQELSKSMNSGVKQINQAEALANLFSRYGYQPFALTIWSSVSERLPPETAAKALFWKRVLRTPEVPENVASNSTPYLQYLASIPQNAFWDANAFNKLANAQQLLDTQQETYWLRLLDLIARGKEQEALALIKSNPFKAASWNQPLELALESALNKRQNTTIAYREPLIPSALDVEYGTAAWTKPEDNAFILDLIALSQGNKTLSHDDEALLNSENAFSAIFMAEGWEKAALNLFQHEQQPSDYPEWYAVEMTKSLGKEKGTEEALKFALQQKPSSQLTLQVGELYFVNNKPEEGLRVLQGLTTENSEAGARAAWISAQYYWRKGNLDAARQVIMANPHLASTPMGQEALTIISTKHKKE